MNISGLLTTWTPDGILASAAIMAPNAYLEHYMAKTRVRVVTFVDKQLRDQFQEQYPFHASVSWLLEQAMRELLDATSGSPSLTSRVRLAVRAALQENRRSETTDVTATVEPL